MGLLHHSKSFHEVKLEWENLLNNNNMRDIPFFYFWEWKKIWWNIFKSEEKQLHFISNEKKSIIAPLIQQNELITFIGSMDLIDYQDFIYEKDFSVDYLRDLLDYCFYELNSKIIRLESILEGSPTLNAIRQLASNTRFCIEVSGEDVAPYINLSDSWDSYLAMLTKKNRHEIKRKMRRVEMEENVTTLEITKEKDVMSAAKDVIKLMKLDEKKEKFLTSEREAFFKEIIKFGSKKNLVRIIITKVGDDICSGSINFRNGYTNLLYNSGYNPQYKSLSIGLINHIRNIRMCINNGVRVFDFLRGNEDYKYRLGASDKSIHTIQISLTDQK